MKVLKIFTTAFIFYSLILIGPGTVFAAYPDKPVRVIVPFPPGGATDIVGREISEKLSQAFKQTFIVENNREQVAILVWKWLLEHLLMATL